MQPSHAQAAIPSFLAGRAAFLRKLFGYTGASALALSLDFTVFSLLSHNGVGAVLAAAVGYLSGLVVSYVLSRTIVFRSERVGKAGAGEALGFILTGVVGLGITSAVVAVATHVFHLPPAVAKLLAVGISFFTVFLLRSRFVFGENPQ
ncbi:hypothetical protein PbB2_02731 [Candidatus Phycosocius bacilliformis]|uniref:GtrA/DPMS transmembrane domain-containing protein n=1 Tax=Candidatus Phycosocius bacilliformis TaxID=1445552 RepID=A0A2P2ED96_9PROT|nr:GtrA family protein [Candidatus Phycosocius bacilliformis]GBF59039.1 hypothetical protein PbB2_02731 [Candidatus Phycosocius bacilliformis]